MFGETKAIDQEVCTPFRFEMLTAGKRCLAYVSRAGRDVLMGYLTLWPVHGTTQATLAGVGLPRSYRPVGNPQAFSTLYK